MSLETTQSFRTGLVAVVLLAALFPGCNHQGDSGAQDREEDEMHAPVVVVRTVPAQIRSIEEVIHAIGRSEALPNHLVTLTPAVEGHVEKILVNLGDFVHRDDPIVELARKVAEADTAEKQANRDTLKAALELLQAEPRLEDRKGLEVTVELAKAAVDRAKVAVERLQPLRARQEISTAQMYDIEQLLVQAQLQQQSAEAQLELLLAGPKPEAVAEATARRAAAEGVLALSQAHLELHSIRSPIDGILDSITCHLGQTISPGTAIGEVVNTDQLNVVAWLPPQSATKVSVGQAARLVIGESTLQRVGANAGESAEPAAGQVVSIGRIVDAQTGNLPVRVLVENRMGRIAVGETLTVTIVVQERASELVVPATALVDLGEGPLLVVVRDGKVVQLRSASITTHGEWTVVSGSDLQAGEQVVVEGGFNLPEGTPVQVEKVSRPPMAEAR